MTESILSSESLDPPAPDSIGAGVLAVVELATIVAEHCTASSMINLGNTCRLCRSIVVDIIKTRIVHFLGRFIAEDSITAFFDLLRGTHSGLCGSFAFSVINPNPLIDSNDMMANLNIVIPRGEGILLRWTIFLEVRGYKVVSNMPPTYPYHWATRRQIAFQDDDEHKIIIIESQEADILPPVISSPVTTMLNIVTASNIYCFYPRLTSRGMALRGYLPIGVDKEKRLKKRGIDFQQTNEFLGTPCYESCTKIWRYTLDMKGVGVFCWRGQGDGERHWAAAEDVLHLRCYKWRLGFDCHNPRCARFLTFFGHPDWDTAN